MIKGDRLKERLEACDMSQAELARAVGVTPQAISKMVLGETTDSPKIYRIASSLRTTPEYLSGESDEAEPSKARDQRQEWRAPPEVDADEVAIDSIDLSFGMGGTFVDVEPGALEIEKAKFSRAWLRKFTHSSPELLFTTSGVGDSMMPTINDHDVVVVDRSERLTDAMGEKVWAVVFGGVGMIKRLRPMPDGTVKLMSDNQAVRDELATDNDLHIVGRVVAVVRRM